MFFNRIIPRDVLIKKIVIILSFTIVFCLIAFSKKYVSIPTITLKGKTIIDLVEGEKFDEPGYSASDKKDGNISDKVKVQGTVNYDKSGIYEILYSVKNSDNKTSEVKRIVRVKEKKYTYKDEYDNIDNTSRGWWSNNRFDGKRPSGGADINELKKYGAYYLGEDRKVLYLTFDEGSLETYVREIVDVLNNNDVKGTFFLCKTFIEKNPDLMKLIYNTGHSVGNHTFHHENMPSLATRENFDKYLYEIQETERVFYDNTGNHMDKVYRDPRGEWSYRDLSIMKDLGYRSFFYSANYDDFSSVLSKEKALSEMVKRVHNGAIYLIHPNNKGNYEALEPFILEMKKQGFVFDLVKNIK